MNISSMTQNDRKMVGLALGGGAARGLAHIGALSVLEEAGIPIDYVAGSSAGSVIGALYCAGLDSRQIKEIGLGLQWWHLVQPVWPQRGLVSFDRLAHWLISKIGDLNIEDLKTPYVAVATDLQTGEPVMLTRGRLALAVQASCSVPGLVEPVELDGRLLGDGSISNTLPVSALRQLGADYIIGVDIFLSSIRPHLGAVAMGLNALEILLRRVGGGIAEADCLIVPDLAGCSYISFTRREEIYQRGEIAARAQLNTICSALGICGIGTGDENPGA